MDTNWKGTQTFNRSNRFNRSMMLLPLFIPFFFFAGFFAGEEDHHHHHPSRANNVKVTAKVAMANQPLDANDWARQI
jgi:hypothetical protein